MRGDLKIAAVIRAAPGFTSLGGLARFIMQATFLALVELAIIFLRFLNHGFDPADYHFHAG
jgi:hypothetical protein